METEITQSKRISNQHHKSNSPANLMPTPHCMVLPRGRFTSMIPETLAAYA